MRIALYHNLPQGGALRFVEEVIRRSSVQHEYHLYRVVGEPSRIASGSIKYGDVIVHDIPRRLIWGALSHRVRMARLPIELWSLWEAEKEVAKQIDAGSYDVCFVNPCGVTQSPSILYRLRSRTLYYAQETRRMSFERPMMTENNSHASVTRRLLGYPFERALRRSDRRAFGAAGMIATNSAFSAERIYAAYGRTATVVPLGVDTDVFQPQGTNRANFVLSVGGLDAIKGHRMIVDALARLPEGSRPELRIAFERSTRGFDVTLRRLAEERHVALHLHHAVSDAELAGLYSSALATVCAARLEPFGLTPLESLACGTPVVAINEGGFRESVLNGRNGFLVPPTPAGIADGIAKITAGMLGASRAELREYVATRTWDRTVTALNDVFNVAAGH